MSEAWEKAYNAADAAGLAALYAKDATVMLPTPSGLRQQRHPDVPRRGREGEREEALTTETSRGPATTRSRRANTVATTADGKHLDHGKYVTVYKKADGGWKIYRDIWNSDMASK